MTFSELVAWIVSAEGGCIEIGQDSITKSVIIRIGFKFDGQNWSDVQTVTKKELLHSSFEDAISYRIGLLKRRFDEIIAKRTAEKETT